MNVPGLGAIKTKRRVKNVEGKGKIILSLLSNHLLPTQKKMKKDNKMKIEIVGGKS